MIKLVTVDLDDTLWESGPVLKRAEDAQYEWLARHVPEVSEAYSVEELRAKRIALAGRRADINHDFTKLRLAAMGEVFREFGYQPGMAATAIAIFLEVRSRVTLFADVEPAIQELRKEFKVVALTNGNTDLDRAGVSGLFDFALSPAETGTSKPDPRMFDLAVERARVEHHSVVHVGDEPFYDIEAAHRSSIASIWMNRSGSRWPDGYRPAHAEVDSMTQVRPAIDRIIKMRSKRSGMR